ncbi:MAG: SPOR domain-containing protein [Myxococcota bacterium]
MRRQHRRVHLSGPRWAFALAPLFLVVSWAGAFTLGRWKAAEWTPPVDGPRPSAAMKEALLPAPLGPTSSIPSSLVAMTNPVETSTTPFRFAFAPPPARGWGFQVGAFETKEEAEAWMRAHRPESPAFVSEVDLGARGTWYRLRLGRFGSRREARAAARAWAERLEEAPLIVEYP